MTVSLVFCGTLNSGSGCISEFFVCCWDSFAPIGWPCPAEYEDFCLSYISFCLLWVISLGSLFFFFCRGNGGEMDMRERRGGEAGKDGGREN